MVCSEIVGISVPVTASTCCTYGTQRLARAQDAVYMFAVTRSGQSRRRISSSTFGEGQIQAVSIMKTDRQPFKG